MNKKPRPPRAKEANNKKFRKKTSVLTSEKVEYVDYKDVNLLNRFLSDRSKIRSRRVNGNDVQQQNEIARAVKNAREMALLPYTKRVDSARAPRPGSEREDDDKYVDKYADKVADDATTEAAEVAADVETEVEA